MSALGTARPVKPIDPIVQEKTRVWLAWRELTGAERAVAGIIVTLPLWWAIGFEYLLLVLLASIALSDLLRKGRLHWGRPAPEAIALLAFGLYTLVNTNLQAEAVTGRTIAGPLALWVGGAMLLWYIRGNRLRVRLGVVAGAFAVSLAQMGALWGVTRLVLGEAYYNPPPSLFAALFARLQPAVPGTSNPNYLQPYIPGDIVFADFARYGFFFTYPEVAGLVAGCIILIAFDLESATWRGWLLTGGLFALVMSGSRSVWLALPVVFVVRVLMAAGRGGGVTALLALAAAASFTLAQPPVTDWLSDTLRGTATATGEYRRGSTEVRARIYERTWDRLAEAPLWGHGVPGRTVLPGFQYAGVGTHSFLLGGLLYISGLAGTLLFVGFAVALGRGLWRERHRRPAACLTVPLLMLLVLAVMEFEPLKMGLLLLVAMLYRQETSIREGTCAPG